jgi:biotin carboxyl carrier protein
MKYYVTLNGDEIAVEINDEGGRLSGTIDGKTYPLDCSVIEAGSKYSILIGRESLNVTVNPGTSRLDLIIGGHIYRTRVLDERERGALELEKDRKGGGGVVRSVMPGIVLKVFVAEGDQVEVGTPLLILEAMKMENEIRAEGEGTVAKIHVEEGMAVNSNVSLLTIQ